MKYPVLHKTDKPNTVKRKVIWYLSCQPLGKSNHIYVDSSKSELLKVWAQIKKDCGEFSWAHLDWIDPCNANLSAITREPVHLSDPKQLLTK